MNVTFGMLASAVICWIVNATSLRFMSDSVPLALWPSTTLKEGLSGSDFMPSNVNVSWTAAPSRFVTATPGWSAPTS